MTDHITRHQDGYVLTLTIARPERKNALTQAMYGALADALVAADSDPSIRVTIITGEGDMFTAGNDLGDFSSGMPAGKPPVQRFLEAIRDLQKPLLAAVNGPAIGVGLTMLLHCDIAYASETANFRAPFTQLGLVPEAGSSLLLPATVGNSMANEILLAGRILSAAEALDCGLVSRVVPAADLHAAITACASAIAASAPTAIRQSKRLIRLNKKAIRDQMAAESIVFADQLKSREFREAATAFAEKRKPVFPD